MTLEPISLTTRLDGLLASPTSRSPLFRGLTVVPNLSQPEEELLVARIPLLMAIGRIHYQKAEYVREWDTAETPETPESFNKLMCILCELVHLVYGPANMFVLKDVVGIARKVVALAQVCCGMSMTVD